VIIKESTPASAAIAALARGGGADPHGDVRCPAGDADRRLRQLLAVLGVQRPGLTVIAGHADAVGTPVQVPLHDFGEAVDHKIAGGVEG
jgi:hypothetical protein